MVSAPPIDPAPAPLLTWRRLAESLARGGLAAAAAGLAFGPAAALLCGPTFFFAAWVELWAERRPGWRARVAGALGVGAVALVAVPALVFQGLYAEQALAEGSGAAAATVGEALAALPADAREVPAHVAWLEGLPWYFAPDEGATYCVLATALLAAAVLALAAGCRLLVRSDDRDLGVKMSALGVLASATGAALLGTAWFFTPLLSGPESSADGLREALAGWGFAILLGLAWPIGGLAGDWLRPDEGDAAP